MKVGISLKHGSYTPEAYAYEKYLTSNGVQVQLDYDDSLYLDNDLNIFFMGFRAGKKYRNTISHEIHEYQSLSTAPLAKFKDYLKVSLNNQPNGRIFLNEIVRDKLNFSDSVPYIYRDMGVDQEFYQRQSCNLDFDIVYSGSIHGRPGLIKQLYRLASLGFKLLVIGNVEECIIKQFKFFNGNVVFTGRVDRSELPSLYRICRAGLNFTPDLYPFNIQTSTKTLEYLASGLKVITNKYYWSQKFFYRQEQHCIFLEDINDFTFIENNSESFVGIEDYEWDNVLTASGFYRFINGVIS